MPIRLILILMSWSDCFLSQSKYLINSRTEKQNKNKSKKRFIGLNEKYPKREESLNTYLRTYLRETNVQNALEYS